MTSRIGLIGFLAAVMLLAACSGTTDEPARAVEDYLQALADKDADRLALLSCAEWEEDARMTLDSFAAVDVTLQDVSCETRSSEADSAVVNCSGAVALSYEGEIRELDLSEESFQVVSQSGEWLVCGSE